MEAKTALLEYKDIIEVEIKKFFKEKLAEASSLSPYARIITKSLFVFTNRGGKRLRSALLYHTYRMFKKNNQKDIIKAGVAIELIHSYLLIHDDIIDEDKLRRGGHTIPYEYELFHSNRFHKRDSRHFGESMAICIGDLSSHYSLELLSSLRFPEKYKNEALELVNKQIADVIFGEALDVLLEVRDDVKQKDIILVHRLKTARYTFETPMYVGAILAGVNDKVLGRISKYAIPAGIAFQIQDDILGMFGDETKMGKPSYSDLQEGKQTLLILKAIERGTSKEVKVIIEALGNKNLTKKQHEDVKEIIDRTGSLDYSRSLAKRYVNKSKKALIELKPYSKRLEFFEAIADYMVKREF